MTRTPLEVTDYDTWHTRQKVARSEVSSTGPHMGLRVVLPHTDEAKGEVVGVVGCKVLVFWERCASAYSRPAEHYTVYRPETFEHLLKVGSLQVLDEEGVL